MRLDAIRIDNNSSIVEALVNDHSFYKYTGLYWATMKTMLTVILWIKPDDAICIFWLYHQRYRPFLGWDFYAVGCDTHWQPSINHQGTGTRPFILQIRRGVSREHENNVKCNPRNQREGQPGYMQSNQMIWYVYLGLTFRDIRHS